MVREEDTRTCKGEDDEEKKKNRVRDNERTKTLNIDGTHTVVAFKRTA